MADTTRNWKGLPTGEARVFPLVKSQRNPFASVFTIGRAVNNDLFLVDDSVSKFHASLRRSGESEWKLQDHGSTNGTRVNGVALTPHVEHRLSSGDQLMFGHMGSMFVDREGLAALCTYIT